MEPSRSLSFRVGDWHVDPALDVISGRDGASTKLVPKSMEVLVFLARRAGVVVNEEEIHAAVWPDVIVTSSSVYQAIADLRRAFGDDKRKPTYIATIPRKGYRLIAPVTWQPEVASDPPPVESPIPATDAAPAPSPAAAAPPLRPRIVPWAVAVAALLVVGSGALWFMRGPGTSSAPPAKSIAVLPLDDFSEAHDQGAFADGLTEELLNTLAQVEGLRVTARTSTFVFKDRHEDVRTIGRMLGARYVLEGSVRRDAARVRVIAQLVDTNDGYHLWSKTFDRPTGDILTMQEEIAHAVTDALQLTLSRQSASRIASRQPVRVEAFELYLLGRHYQLERNPEMLAKAIAYHEQAIAADPTFALAYAGLADATMATYYYSNVPLDDVARVINPLLAKGLELNPALPELYAARAVLRLERMQIAEAQQDLRHAIELNPNHADTYVRLGASYDYDGRPRDALEVLARGAELDPLHYILHTRRCLVLQNLARYAQADAACNQAIGLAPTLPNAYWARGLNALSTGAHEGAIAGYREALDRAPQRVDLLQQIGLLYLDVGLVAEARASFERAMAVLGARSNADYLSHTRPYLATDDIAGLTRYLDSPGLRAAAEAEPSFDLALLELTAGRPAAARIHAQRARAAKDFDERRLWSSWVVRWGNSDILTLALVERATGDAGAAERSLNELAGYLDTLERNGNVWHGLHYVRASVLAQQGRIDAAHAELDRAAKLGWRRNWWARHDPALAPLHDTPRFKQWLASIEQSNAQVRAAVLAAASTTSR